MLGTACMNSVIICVAGSEIGLIFKNSKPATTIGNKIPPKTNAPKKEEALKSTLKPFSSSVLSIFFAASETKLDANVAIIQPA